MDSKFISHVEALKPQLKQLLDRAPVTPGTLPTKMPRKGVYLLSDGGTHLYVGRSNDIRKRIGRHSRPSATYRMAAFAFRLAREATGNLKATYKKGEGSRSALMEDEKFVAEFDAAKARIRRMDLRFVEENDPVRQALLEIYVAVVLNTPYNDFDNH
jgi:predicted GIY-YIG superfamily endonuclease